MRQQLDQEEATIDRIVIDRFRNVNQSINTCTIHPKCDIINTVHAIIYVHAQ